VLCTTSSRYYNSALEWGVPADPSIAAARVPRYSPLPMVLEYSSTRVPADAQMFGCSHISGTCTRRAFLCIDIGGEGCTHQRNTDFPEFTPSRHAKEDAEREGHRQERGALLLRRRLLRRLLLMLRHARPALARMGRTHVPLPGLACCVAWPTRTRTELLRRR
jgi:hypothetical protein